MSDFKDFARDLGYFGVGAAAVIVEAGGKTIKALVRKGEKTLRENQDTVDDLKRKARELGDKVKDTVEKATAKPESPEAAAPMDAAAMSPEERAELRRQLDEADAVCETDTAHPVAPDVIYRTDEPLPEEEAVPEEASAPDTSVEEEKPEETING